MYPESICGPRKTDQVVFVCWRNKAHDGSHLSFLRIPDLDQVHGLLLDSEGRATQPQPTDMALLNAGLERFLEYIDD